MAFSYCECQNCKYVKFNSENNIWIHRGKGNLSREEFDILECGSIVEDIFDPPNKNFRRNQVSKPIGAIWFSNGSWLFDPYCEGGHNKVDSDEHKVKKTRVLCTKLPKNILHIATLTELDEFTEKYTGMTTSIETIGVLNEIRKIEKDSRIKQLLKGTYEEIMEEQRKFFEANFIDFDNLVEIIEKNCLETDVNSIKKHKEIKECIGDKNITIEVIYNFIKLKKLKSIDETFERNYDIIFWDKVAEDGYYGISFYFRKARHLPGYNDANSNKYIWHCAWDVESLCIFDLRAFGDITIEEV